MSIWHDLEHGAKGAANKAGDAAKDAGKKAGDAAKGAANTVAGAATTAGNAIAGAATTAGNAIADGTMTAIHTVEGVTIDVWNDLQQAVKWFELLKKIDFDSTRPIKGPDPKAVRDQASKGQRKPVKRVAHASTASDITRKAMDMAGAGSQVDKGGRVAKQTDYLFAVGVGADVLFNAGIPAAGGSYQGGYFWEYDGDWGPYISLQADAGVGYGVDAELVFTFIHKKYGFKGFNGPAEAMSLSVSLPEDGVVTLTLLFANSDQKPMGFSVGGGLGFGSPISIYGAFSNTFAGFLQGSPG